MSVPNISTSDAKFVYGYMHNKIPKTSENIAEFSRITNGLSNQQIEQICDENDYSGISDDQWESWNEDGADEIDYTSGDAAWQGARPAIGSALNKGVDTLQNSEKMAELGKKGADWINSTKLGKLGKKGADAVNKGTDVANKGADVANKGADVANKGAEAASEGGGASAGGIIAVVMAGIQLAMALVRLAAPANKSENEQLKDINENALPEKQEQSSMVIEETTAMSEDGTERAESMVDQSNQTNTEMEEGLSEYELLQREIEMYDKMKTAGHEFTADEAKKYDEIIAKMETMKTDNDEKTEDLSTTIADNYSEVSEFNDIFDENAEIAATNEGFLNKSIEMSQNTAKAAEAEGKVCSDAATSDFTSLGLNLLQATMSFTSLNVADGVLYTAASVTNGIAGAADLNNAKTQADFQAQANTTYNNSNAAQNMNNAAIEAYETNLDTHNANMDALAMIQVVTPELTVPEKETPIVGNQNNALPEDDEDGNEDDKKNPKKPDVNGRK